MNLRQLALCIAGFAGCSHDRADERAAPAGAVAWWGRRPVIVDVNQDGVGDIVGMCRPDVGRDVSLVCAFDGATFAPIWKSDLHTRVQARMVAAQAGGRLVIGYETGQVDIYRLTDGVYLSSAPRSSRPYGYACAAKDGVWLVHPDGTGSLIDVMRGTSAGAEIPPSCRRDICSRETATSALCPPPQLPPEWEARQFHEWMTLADGEHAVAVGNEEEACTIGGFKIAPAGGVPKALWLRSCATVALDALQSARAEGEIRDGKFLTHYVDTARRGRRLLLDLRTGKTIWDLPNLGVDPIIDGNRIFEPSESRVFVRGLADGRVLGSIGKAPRGAK